MTHKDVLWCLGWDLDFGPVLRTRKLYTSRRAPSSESARKTKSSHTTSHTGGPELSQLDLLGDV
jgi:hypothetical protein